MPIGEWVLHTACADIGAWPASAERPLTAAVNLSARQLRAGPPGYSSLANLRRFPVDALKIDRSFGSHIATSADDAAIAASVIAMGHGMNLKAVIAEGVGTREQLALLRERGCDAFQGFLFGRPQPRPAPAV